MDDEATRKKMHRARVQRERRARWSPEERAANNDACKAYALANRDSVLASKKDYYIRNKELFAAKHKQRYLENAVFREAAKQRANEWRLNNPALDVQRKREWADANKDRVLAYFRASKAKRRVNPLNRVSNSIGAQLRQAIASRKAGRRWESIVGYTIHDLARHLERQFSHGMNWANYGVEWHIDHIVPQIAFESDPDDAAIRLCWALTNLRPLAGFDNRSKGSRRTHLL